MEIDNASVTQSRAAGPFACPLIALASQAFFHSRISSRISFLAVGREVWNGATSP